MSQLVVDHRVAQRRVHEDRVEDALVRYVDVLKEAHEAGLLDEEAPDVVGGLA